MGTALATLGRMKEAAAHFTDAVRLDPKSANARRNLARVLTQQGMLEAAKIQEREAERLDAR